MDYLFLDVIYVLKIKYIMTEHSSFTHSPVPTRFLSLPLYKSACVSMRYKEYDGCSDLNSIGKAAEPSAIEYVENTPKIVYEGIQRRTVHVLTCVRDKLTKQLNS